MREDTVNLLVLMFTFLIPDECYAKIERAYMVRTIDHEDMQKQKDEEIGENEGLMQAKSPFPNNEFDDEQRPLISYR